MKWNSVFIGDGHGCKRSLIFLITLLMCSCATLDPRTFLQQRIDGYFGRAPIQFVTTEDFDRINNLTDRRTYFKELSLLLSHKTVGDMPGWGGIPSSFNKDVSVSQIDRQMIAASSEDPTFADAIWEIYTELNLRPTPGYVLSYLNGRYKYIYKLLSGLEGESSKGSIRRLIETMPSLKALVLAQYVLKEWSKASPDQAEARQLYDTINEGNFKKLVSQSKLFFFDAVPAESNQHLLEGYIETLSYYQDLQEMLRRVTAG